MGLHSMSLSFRNTTQAAVTQAIRDLLSGHHAFVSPELHGWVTVFDYNCEGGPVSRVLDTAGAICARCCCSCIALQVIHSDCLCYWLFTDSGELETASYPVDYYHASALECSGLGGTPERIARLCRSGVSREAVRAALSKETILKDENLTALEGLLGIEAGTVSMSYGYLASRSASIDDNE